MDPHQLTRRRYVVSIVALSGAVGAAQTDGTRPEPDEAAQNAAMRAFEDEPYFTAIQGRVRAGIYMSPEFWQHVGDPGPSEHAQKGRH